MKDERHTQLSSVITKIQFHTWLGKKNWISFHFNDLTSHHKSVFLLCTKVIEFTRTGTGVRSLLAQYL